MVSSLQGNQDEKDEYDYYDEPIPLEGGPTLRQKVRSMQNQNCEVCQIMSSKPDTILYQDEHCAICTDASVKSSCADLTVIPLRHIRNVYHLRPWYDFFALSNRKKVAIHNQENLLADLKLIDHMQKVATKFMRRSYHQKNEKIAYFDRAFLSFDLPPMDTTAKHLTMNIYNFPEHIGVQKSTAIKVS